MNSIAKAGFKEGQQRDARGRWSSSGGQGGGGSKFFARHKRKIALGAAVAAGVGGTVAAGAAVRAAARRTGASEKSLRSFGSNLTSATFNAAKALTNILDLRSSVREGVYGSTPDLALTAKEHLSALKDDLKRLRSDVRALRTETRVGRARAYRRIRTKLQQVDARLKTGLRVLSRRSAVNG